VHDDIIFESSELGARTQRTTVTAFWSFTFRAFPYVRRLFNYTKRIHNLCLIRTYTELILHFSVHLTSSSGRT